MKVIYDGYTNIVEFFAPTLYSLFIQQSLELRIIKQRSRWQTRRRGSLFPKRKRRWVPISSFLFWLVTLKKWSHRKGDLDPKVIMSNQNFSIRRWVRRYIAAKVSQPFVSRHSYECEIAREISRARNGIRYIISLIPLKFRPWVNFCTENFLLKMIPK